MIQNFDVYFYEMIKAEFMPQDTIFNLSHNFIYIARKYVY